MGQSTDIIVAKVLMVLMFGVGALFVIFLCLRLCIALLRCSILCFVGFAAYLFAQASRTVNSRFSSPSELPHSEIHRRRDLMGGSAMRHEYPGVIPSYDSRSERMLNRYGRYLNVYLKKPDTNATVFRIRSWLRNCEQNHNGRNGNPHCRPLNEDGHGYPLWLIDIEQRCVVPFQASLSYFALSYVWGQVETAKMERSNFVQLQQHGSLLGPHQVVNLPKTIKDAMFLTGFLGHQYLWCDRLCLVQDDISSILPQIQQMAEIYARAYCTIIAFDNMDANSGLHGLPSLTRRSYQDLSTSANTKHPHWWARAWTFQEELFSVRIIRLCSYAVKWQCSPLRENKSTYGSNDCDSSSIRSLKSNVSNLGYSVQVGGMFCPRHASLKYYINLAEEYSTRHVNEQHPEDIFHAFSSVQSILKVSYPGAFIQGIPECLLVQCLLWEAGAQGRKGFINPVTGMRVSSWSWIGRSNHIYYPRSILLRGAPRPCKGLVSWYVSVKEDSRRYLVSIAKEDIWTRHKKVEGGSSASILPLNASLTDKDMSLESQGFQHTIPLSADSRETSTLEVKNLCSFLHGRVLMARFRVQLDYTQRTDQITLTVYGGEHQEEPVRVLLCETSGNYAGLLCDRSDLLEDGQVISLICISESSIEADHCCMSHFRSSGLLPKEAVKPITRGACIFPSPDKKVYELYNALWVEYEDGVAYRKGIGRIRKEVWDRETLGWVDVTLG